MAPKLQIKRGLKKDLPTLASGEFGLCEDTGELFVGTQSGNLPVVSASGAGDMLKSVYDADNDGVVDKAESVPWAGVTGKPATFAPASHNHTKSQITDMPASLPANGGNADTVDGKHASEFATAAQGAKADAALPARGGVISDNIHLAANASETADVIFDRPGDYEYEAHMDAIRNSLRVYTYNRAGQYNQPFTIDFSADGIVTKLLDANSHKTSFEWEGAGLRVNVDAEKDLPVHKAHSDRLGNQIDSTYVPRSGGDMSGYLKFGTTNTGLEWYTASGTRYHVRPWSPSNVFQITRLTKGGSEQGVLNIYDSSAEFIGNAATASRSATGTFPIGSGKIVSRANQKIVLYASNEDLYGLYYGVPDVFKKWTFCPDNDNRIWLGEPNGRWNQIYSTQTSISTSDRNRKTDIQSLDAATALSFLRLLQPVSYKMLDGSSGRTHWGLIAQDVWDAMQRVGLSDRDFAGYCRDVKTQKVQVVRQQAVLDHEDGDVLGVEDMLADEDVPVTGTDGTPEYIYGLRYEEFIPLALLGAQESLQRADELEAENKQLKEALAALTDRVAALEKGA